MSGSGLKGRALDFRELRLGLGFRDSGFGPQGSGFRV